MRLTRGLAVLFVALPAVAAWAADSALVDAVKRGNPQAVRALIRQGADVDAVEPDGTTALHWAVRTGQAEVVDALIDAGANVSVRNRYGITPLSLAAELGDPAVVERLLKAGADAKVVITEGQTVLMVAARTGNPEVIRQLAAFGADVNAGDAWMGETALMWAAGANNAAAVRTLVELGADIDARSAMVPYPEQKPAEPSNYVASFVPKGQWTALMYAARENAIDASRALVEAGANLDVQDPEGVTPLMEAILNLHYDLAYMLVEKGADPTIADKAGMTPVFAVVEMRTPVWERSRPRLEERGEIDGPTLVGALIDHGADPNAALTGRQLARYHAGGSAAFAAGTTPLMQAVRFKHLDLARLLVERGADVTLKQPDGTTALMIASGVKYAITQEGDPDNMGTPQDAFEIVRLLVERGAGVNEANERGETAMYGAAFLGNELIIKYLAARGARLDVKTKTGRSLYDGVLNTGVPDEGTGARPGGKPGPATVELVRRLMLDAGVEPTSMEVGRRDARVRGQGLTDPDPDPAPAPAAAQPQAPR
ncbi:MAG: ankyrin repeat domain-containing protein [Acidobacteria bacterium]|nr:ankyrin repeat domain-containing protein [Acidobacteriota bacterium]